MPGRFELTSTLAKIWHAPDHFRLLDPLPPMHRRGIIAGFLLVIIGILLPSDDSQSPASTSREANLNLQSQSQPQAGGNQAVPLPPITNGITFGASPDWNFPTETTAISPGVTLRDTTV